MIKAITITINSDSSGITTIAKIDIKNSNVGRHDQIERAKRIGYSTPLSPVAREAVHFNALHPVDRFQTLVAEAEALEPRKVAHAAVEVSRPREVKHRKPVHGTVAKRAAWRRGLVSTPPRLQPRARCTLHLRWKSSASVIRFHSRVFAAVEQCESSSFYYIQ